MWVDPIVADVHRTREKLSAEFDFDVKAIFADLRKRQAALGDRLVPQRKRGEAGAGGDRSRQIGPHVSVPTEAAPAGKDVS